MALPPGRYTRLRLVLGSENRVVLDDQSIHPLGLAPGLVVLPDPRRRVRMDDRAGIARFAQRMAPADCLALDHGACVILDKAGDGGSIARAEAQRLTQTGAVLQLSTPAGSAPS